MIHRMYGALWFSGQDLVEDSFYLSFDMARFTRVNKSCQLAANYSGNYCMKKKIFC